MKIIKKLISGIIVLSMMLAIVPLAVAAPTKPTLKEPINGQIIPFYEVWIRWNDVSNEDHYIMTVRDITNGDSGPLIYNRQRVSKNSTYFVIPTSKLTKGHTYRWCLGAVDSSGGETLCPAWTFRIEYGDDVSGWDTHIAKGGFASASHIDYFIYAKSSSFDDIMESGVEAWNGISSKVNLHRDANPAGGDAGYEMGVFESPNPPDPVTFGKAVWKVGGMNGTEIAEGDTVSRCDYVEVQIFKQNILISAASKYKEVVMHEVGHALSLLHTNIKGNSIAITTDGTKNVQHVMNTRYEIQPNSPSTTDRDHLRIKWGA